MDEKSLYSIIATVVITALIAGGIGYFSQKSKSLGWQSDLISQQKENEELNEKIADLENQIATLKNDPTETDEVPVDKNPVNNPEDPVNLDDFDDFTIFMNGNALTVGTTAWGDQSSLLQTLGKPISEKTEILGSGSDTYMGMTKKTTKYNGLELVSYSSKNDGKRFFVMEMKITGAEYKTKRGIKIENSVNDLKKLYPNITIALDGRTDPNNCSYRYRNTAEVQYKGIYFEIKNSKIIEIKIGHGFDGSY